MKTQFQSATLLQIGTKLRIQRHLQNEKMDTVANALGFTSAVISRIENGSYNSLKFETLVKLCSHLEIPLEEVLKGNSL